MKTLNGRLAAALTAATLFVAIPRADAQSCYTKTTVGGGSTVNLVSAVEAAGTSIANVNALENNDLDASSYLLQTFTGPASITVATALVSGPIADNDRAPFGLTFINGSPNAVTVTEVNITSDAAHPPIFRSSPPVTTIDPAVGTWSVPDGRTIRWTGSLIVPAKSAQGFIARVAVQNIGLPNTGVVVGGTITTASLGVLTANGFPTDVYTPDRSNKVGEGVVAFVDAGNYPRTINDAVAGTNLIGGQASTIRVRVSEYANNQAIAAGLQLTVTVPAGWTINSVTTGAGAPAWGSATITQPTSAVDGSISISTLAVLGKGNTAPDVILNVTPPVVYTKSTFQMKASLLGFDTSSGSQGQHPIRSVCDGGGTVLPPSGGPGVAPVLNAEFLSPRLNVSAGSAPVSQFTISTEFDIRNHSGAIGVTFEAFNFTTNAWQTLGVSAFTNTTPQAAIASTISGSNIDDYLDAQSRMRVRYVTSIGGPQTLRIDRLAWSAQLSWYVDSEAGNDNWAGVKFPGSVNNPYQTLAKVATGLSSSEQVQVIGRATPYAGNIVIPAASAGTALCKTLYKALPLGGMAATISGTDPSADVAFQVSGNHARVDGFAISNMFVALAADAAITGTEFANNSITLASGGYGVFLDRTNGATISGNTIASPAGGSPFFGILDYSTQGSVIDNNRVIGIPAAEGVFIESSTAPIIRRNILTGNYMGIHIARTSGTTIVENNTVDSNFYIGAFSESAGPVTSRNNIISRNNRGWQSSTAGNVTSNYDDVWANTNAGYVNVTAGANNIAADPLFAQTNDSTLATYYRLNNGSPCIDSGTTATGLTYLGVAPDRGAVESQ